MTTFANIVVACATKPTRKISAPAGALIAFESVIDQI
jgi:hypothetical protein